ncbi:N-acetyltransferase [Agarivorans sp. Toyoura001]|uniref:GNAT family N-acetyltransferase n=1 Tax=Agarivorans sp. Toyoura001 TaxID=2283141 RepID=UPI0010E69A45|nr:GNAT family N-acetyltransferase [Agarivorans sp. Toyoura001]GDY24737.1 N-acetyltransferase [Agarivorans sp. Toyoura001]
MSLKHKEAFIFTLKLDDLSGAQIIALLQEHLNDMHATSPPESVHALDLSGLKHPSVQFWTIWDGDKLAGCGATKQLDEQHAEIKSMRTSAAYKNQGVASTVLLHLIEQAKTSGVKRLSLETGSMDYFVPAHGLYLKHGFEFCGPFADYSEDPNSKFMCLNL